MMILMTSKCNCQNELMCLSQRAGNIKYHGSIVDLSGDHPEVIRRGLGDVSAFE